jgi:hypothetical protein
MVKDAEFLTSVTKELSDHNYALNFSTLKKNSMSFFFIIDGSNKAPPFGQNKSFKYISHLWGIQRL